MGIEGRPDGGLIRASDAEREAAIDALRDASAEGRLTFEELSDRIEEAATATTRGDLERLTGDLPSAGPVSPPVGAAGPVSPPAGAAGTTIVEAAGEATVFGDVRRSGPWRVPRASRFSTVFGDIELDLREAVVSHPRLELDLNTVFGDLTLFVPEGVVVEVRAKARFGDVRQQAGLQAPAGAPVVVLSGGTWFGDVRVKSQRLRDRVMATLGLSGTSAAPGRIDRRGD